MTTAILERETVSSDELTLKALRNAEYLAKLERSFQQAERGEVVTMTFKEWEEKFCNV
ncbi:hypothetical protein AGMMS49957_01770 [Synergistales bacterium]|nr:hypothetical protein AGMMS49957_01770 [Synergistales bacterium]